MSSAMCASLRTRVCVLDMSAHIGINMKITYYYYAYMYAWRNSYMYAYVQKEYLRMRKYTEAASCCFNCIISLA